MEGRRISNRGKQEVTDGRREGGKEGWRERGRKGGREGGKEGVCMSRWEA